MALAININDLLNKQKIESNRIEYKIESPSELDIEKEVVAFLNYKEGGWGFGRIWNK